MHRILLVEDNPTLGEIITFYINQDSRYTLHWVTNAQEALAIAHQGFDIILLDIMLPDLDGLSVCARLRETIFCPIVFISSLDDEAIIVRALNLGGDDYLVKPFKSAVLLAKIDAIMRRVQGTLAKASPVLHAGALRLDSANHTVTTGEKTVYLSPTEYSILAFFMCNRNRVISLEELYREVWRLESHGDLRTVPVHVSNLRRKVEQNPNDPLHIKTIKRIGYYFDAPDGL